jgi:hypothetical protein
MCVETGPCPVSDASLRETIAPNYCDVSQALDIASIKSWECPS